MNKRFDKTKAELMDDLIDIMCGCSNCGEVNKGFTVDDEGRKICDLCGGTVLNHQEAFDMILALRRDIEDLETELTGVCY